jgi:hypothetical protein
VKVKGLQCRGTGHVTSPARYQLIWLRCKPAVTFRFVVICMLQSPCSYLWLRGASMTMDATCTMQSRQAMALIPALVPSLYNCSAAMGRPPS